MSPHLKSIMTDELRMAISDLAACAKAIEAEVGRKAMLDVVVEVLARRRDKSLPLRIIHFPCGGIGIGIDR